MADAPDAAADEWVVRVAGRGRCAIAAADLPPGTTVARFSGRPYASCPLPSERDRFCAVCFRAAGDGAALRRCGKCKWVRYCSTACQHADWPLHRRECAALAAPSSPLRSLADAPLADLLLAGRCLWRRHASRGKETAEDTAFDELEPAPPDNSDRALARLCDAGGPLRALLPPHESAPSDAAKLLAAFGRNNFGVLSPLLTLVGAGCYPRAALLNHSCAPNCVLAFDGAELEARQT